MDSTLQYLLCFEGESWVVFGVVEMSDVEADGLIVTMNDSFSEMGYRVKRERGTAIDAETQSTVRRLQRDWEFWLSIVTRWREGLEESVDEDYPVRYQCWSALDGAIDYVREMASSNELIVPKSGASFEDSTGDSQSNWYFNADPPPISQFKFGPVFSTLKAVANALNMDERILKNSNGQEFAWIRRLHSRRYGFWFEHQSEHDKVLRAIGTEV